MTIKITALRRAFFNGEIIKPGQVISFNGDTVPAWAKKVSSQKTEEVKEVEKTAETKISDTETSDTSNLSGKTEAELAGILDDLITKSLELNIMLDGLENKTVLEQINELTAAINKANKGV